MGSSFISVGGVLAPVGTDLGVTVAAEAAVAAGDDVLGNRINMSFGVLPIAESPAAVSSTSSNVGSESGQPRTRAGHFRTDRPQIHPAVGYLIGHP